MKRWIWTLLLLTGALHLAAADQAPEHIRFADMELTLASGARKYIDDFIGQLKKSPTHFRSLVQRCNAYLPLVEQALAEEGAPEDLKYLIIQESSIDGAAVSKSGAVGFWQFKEPAAREVGLAINSHIDERRHLYRSTQGAARYLFRINRDFDNWVYAVIGYNRGPYGALKYVSPSNYGKKKLTLNSNTHWYALKAIAFKVAFEDELYQEPAPLRMVAKRSAGETSVSKLAKANDLEVAVFKSYNLWIKGNSLPGDKDYFVVVPDKGAPLIAGSTGAGAPRKDRTRPRTPPRPDKSGRSNPVAPTGDRRFTSLHPRDDPDHGKAYVVLQAGEKLVEISVREKIRLKKLRGYNGLTRGSRLAAGTVLRLKKVEKMPYHIVGRGDTWSAIARLYDMDEQALKRKNRTRKLGSTLYVGQKLYLKRRKPKGERIILLEGTFPRSRSGSDPKKSKPLPSPSRYQTHTVKAGETLWKISRQYGMEVEELRSLNRIKGNEISVGQELKVKIR